MSWIKCIPGLKARDDTPEGHFRLIVYLTVFFFLAAYGMEIGNASGIWTTPVNTEIAKEAFHDFFLVAIGFARAAQVARDKSAGNSENSNQGG